MELCARQNVMTSSVLLKSSTQLYSIQLNCIKQHLTKNTGYQSIYKRFQLECDFLSTIRHPNIIQYLGTHQDPDTGLPILLMELMMDSLTHFLESSTQPIPYHIQVNICHDITLALSFLHSNGIIHRDLSSNNILLIGNVMAKVTDFGMARLHDQNSQASFTIRPGTDVYIYASMQKLFKIDQFTQRI